MAAKYAAICQIYWGGSVMASWLGRRSVMAQRIWNRITPAIAPKAHKSVGDLDAERRMAADADFGLWPMTSDAPRFFDSRSQLKEVERVLRER
jgi:hypothetical protein